MILPSNVRVVLVRPTEPRNVGAVARAMKTMGFGRMALVEPPNHDPALAARVSHHADEVVEGASVLPTLREAIAPCDLVIGTTGRSREFRGDESLTPRRLAAELAAAAAAPEVALIFGPERTGLTNEELALCGRIVTIPTAVRQPSLNLAQAATVVLYELFLAAGAQGEAAAREPEEQGPATAPAAPATAAEIEQVIERLRGTAGLLGFDPEKRERWLRQLRALLHRGGLRSWETNLFHTLARRVERTVAPPSGD